ncbi:MAG: peroxiredoxin [Candidatus Hydrogenedentes bacterium]|nr:peroxiredoxin [Candidatus Hydrogenedentota bacterium]
MRTASHMRFIPIVLLAMAVALVSATQEETKDTAATSTTLTVGDPTPDFEFPKPDRPAGSNETIKLSDLKGKKNVLIAFYPKVFTSGCTTQLCGYRDEFATFKNADTEIIAVSTDEQPESDRFKKEKEFPFCVVGDPKGAIVKAYGVPLREHQGAQYAQRAVFLVDKAGIITHIDLDYKITEDKTSLYDAVAKLSVTTSK